jgi:hypothetical protein
MQSPTLTQINTQLFNMRPTYHPQGLGLVATNKRTIRSGKKYERFFASSPGATTIVKGDADVTDTVQHALAMIKRDGYTMLKLAKELQGKTLAQTCKNIFDFFYQHYQYKIDTPGQEQLRTPARAWRDRTSGVDCDCFSISVGSLLYALNIPFALRIIKMYNKPYFQHIYVVVPKFKGAELSNHTNYLVIDPVLDTNDKEAPYTGKQDFIMQLAELSGITPQGTDIGREMDGFGETCLGTIDTFHARVRNHLVNTRNHIAKNPHRIKGMFKPHEFVKLTDHVLANWHDPKKREAALQYASSIENTLVQPHLAGLHGLLFDDEMDLHSHMDGDFSYIPELNGLGLTGFPGVQSGEDLGKLFAKVKAKIAAKKALKAASPTPKKGFFTRIKNAGKVLKTVANKAGKIASKVAQKAFTAIKKFNPLSIVVRNAFLLAMNMNVFKLADKLSYGYGSQSEAEKAGYNYAQVVNAKNEVEKMFVNVAGGQADKLKQAIINRKHLLHKSKPVKGIDGLGFVVAASVTAAMVAAAPLIAKVTELLKNVTGKKDNSNTDDGSGAQSEGGQPDNGQSSMQPIINPNGGNTNPIDNSGYNNSSSNSNQSSGNFPANTSYPTSPASANDNTNANAPDTDANGNPVKSKMPLILAGVGILAAGAIAFAMSSGHKSAKAVGSVGKKSSTIIHL